MFHHHPLGRCKENELIKENIIYSNNLHEIPSPRIYIDRPKTQKQTSSHTISISLDFTISIDPKRNAEWYGMTSL